MSELSHLDGDGSVNMVNVGGKESSLRRAKAQGRVYLKSAYEKVKNDQLKKGSVVECSKIAGIMAAKKTHELIPLCHGLNLSSVKLDISFSQNYAEIISEVECLGATGVEMEALTAVSISCLTIYDMAKAIDKSMEISDIKLLEKSGGKSGDWSVQDSLEN